MFRSGKLPVSSPSSVQRMANTCFHHIIKQVLWERVPTLDRAEFNTHAAKNGLSKFVTNPIAKVCDSGVQFLISHTFVEHCFGASCLNDFCTYDILSRSETFQYKKLFTDKIFNYTPRDALWFPCAPCGVLRAS